MPPIHQLPAVWNVICAYRDILSLHFSRKGPKRAILPGLLKFCGPILGQNCFQSEYRRVGCPDHRNGTPCSYIAITANLEPPSSRKWSKTGQKGLVWAQSAPFGGPGGPWRAPRTRFGHYCHCLLRLCWTHGYHTLWTNIGPLLYGMVCYLILLYGFPLNVISLYCITWHCIVLYLI